MYYLLLWDYEKYSNNKDGAIESLIIPQKCYELFFSLPIEKFPILSSLSLYDYDIFSSDEELDDIINELNNVTEFCSNDIDIANIKNFILNAKSVGKPIMFDPFR